MKLTACMIVKNEAKMLEKTLPGLSRHVDEIILVDTGSSDETVKVAERYGARIHHFAWINDFSAARNESLKHASGDWILWVDADEYLKEEDLEALRAALADSRAEAHSLTMCESAVGECEKRFSYPRVKLMRNGKGYHFVRPINEQLVDGEGRVAKGPALPVSIYHWGKNLEKESMEEKNRRYVELYSKALEADPDDAYYHFLLGHVLVDLGRLQEAIEHYRKVVEFSRDEYIVRQSLEKIAQTLLRLKDFKAASKAAQDLYKYDPENIPARNVLGALLLLSKKPDAVIQIMTEVLQRKSEEPVENPYQAQALPNILLGQAYELKQEKEKARECRERARKLYPYAMGDN